MLGHFQSLSLSLSAKVCCEKISLIPLSQFLNDFPFLIMTFFMIWRKKGKFSKNVLNPQCGWVWSAIYFKVFFTPPLYGGRGSDSTCTTMYSDLRVD